MLPFFKDTKILGSTIKFYTPRPKVLVFYKAGYYESSLSSFYSSFSSLFFYDSS